MFKFKSVLRFKIVVIITLTFISFTINANVVNLTTEYTKTPIGIDVYTPRFGWQMTAKQDERGILQTACQVVIKDPGKQIIWDSGKITSGNSVGITYAGSELKPATRYTWTVTVWDQKSRSESESSWFETGLGKSGIELEAWSGAKWDRN
jgi:alpha-L-rhamnosidase